MSTAKSKKKITETIYKYNMINAGDTVIVATSGGADSIALLNYMNSVKQEFGITVEAVHVNHGIRGETADGDMMFTQKCCDKLGVRLHVFDASRDGTIIPDKTSEEWARKLRYGYFDTLTTSSTIKIATAHTLSDQAETVVFRMAYGAATKGLSGIPAVRGHFIRPFIEITRTEVEGLCKEYGTEFITDETNLTDDYSRNKIRHHVIPVLKEINPNAEKVIGNICRKMTEIEEYFNEKAENLLNKSKIADGYYDNYIMADADKPILSAAVCQLLQGIRNPEDSTIRLIMECIINGSGSVQVSSECTINVKNNILSFVYRNIEKNDKKFNEGEYSNRFFGVKLVEMTREQFISEVTCKNDLKNYADADKIKDLLLHFKEDGDEFKPACKINKKVKKFMTEMKVKEGAREFLPMLMQDNTIIWMHGQGFTDGFTPTKNTVQVIRVDAF